MGWASIMVILGCTSADLTTMSTSLVQTQREANLTRTALSGTWDGKITALDGVGSKTIILVFIQSAGFSLDGSLLIGEDIRLGGEVRRDTFALVNGVFTEDQIRFNLADSSGLGIILSEGIPVLFTGLLSENSFLSGELQAGPKMIGLWEARVRAAAVGL